MSTINALGFIEVHGFVAGIEAADAMVKSASVRLLRKHEVTPGMVTIVVEGDIAACRAAVNAGVAAASRIGIVLGSHVIGRPVGDTEHMVLDLSGHSKDDFPYPGKSQSKEKVADSTTTENNRAKQQPVPIIQESEKKDIKTKETQIDKPVVETINEEVSETPPDGLYEALEYIFTSSRGRTWGEISKRFPEYVPQLRNSLDACVKTGRLSKAGARYRKPEVKE